MKRDWSKVTAVIKTFLRDEYFFECVRTLREAYPDIKIVVADDGYPTEAKERFAEKYCNKYIRMPFDSGLPSGRNLLVKKHVRTPYVLIGDDDFFFTPETNLEALYDCMEVADLAGGRITEGGTLRNYQGFVSIEDAHINYTKLTPVDPTQMPEEFWDKTSTSVRYKPCDLTFNFVMIKKEVFKKALWDEKIKVAYEHSDFFMTAKNAGFKTVFTPEAVVVHKPQHIKFTSSEYKGYRNRKSDKEHFFRKWRIKTGSDMNNNFDSLEKTAPAPVEHHQLQDTAYCITTFERHDSLVRLLKSIVAHDKSASIYIADDSREFDADRYKKLWDELFASGLEKKPTAWNVNHDAGLSHKRNMFVRMVAEPRLLFLDDDFEFTADTDINKLHKVLDHLPEAGLAGGAVRTDGTLMNWEGTIEQVGADIVLRKSRVKPKKVDNLLAHKVEVMPNFFLARRELLKDFGWDSEIKIHGEHTDFFLRFKDLSWSAYYVPEVIVDHHTTKADEYTPFRRRTEFFELMLKKHNARRLITNNIAQEPDGKGGIKTYRTQEYVD